MLIRLCLAIALSIALTTSAAAQRFTFRQDNTALPPFGGYVPGSGAVITSPPRGGVTFRQGSAGTALPQFGGYVPGTGARFRFGNAMNATARNRAAATAAQQAAAQQAAANGPNVAESANAADSSQRRSDRTDATRALRRQRAAELLLAKGEQAEADGNFALARRYYLAALKRDAADVNPTLRERLDRLTGRAESRP